MQNDFQLVIGLVILGFTIPAIVAAYSERRMPIFATIMLLVGGGLVAWAHTQHPQGYTIEDIPHAFVRVIGYIVR
ncbi:hypothetical protein [Sinisalibacter lacisalsi]|uniref:50S ribosomal protein L35 n=1 Tax=Sinisalibacter lacisalsi TaxID=1526570 RepID=A0ABQ1QPF6_9RHOB|nr:hypothetical protein [Sinisalibacter lacisalsi]GGD37162.1 hypothetical protein GCM10011358_21130 [Sinisalibacter lacisalsi]